MPRLGFGCANELRGNELQGQQFGVEDVELVFANVDLDEVTSYRGAISSLREQAASAPWYLFLPSTLNRRANAFKQGQGPQSKS